jgi:general stress protein 26
MEDLEQIVDEVIKNQKISFISSIDAEGFPDVKAMLFPRKKEGLKYFYYMTNTSSLHVASYKKNPKASIYFCDPRSFQGVVLKGTMEVFEDQASKEMVWQEGDTMYYPLGVTDPDFCVIKFTASKGRYYHNFSSKNFAIE